MSSINKNKTVNEVVEFSIGDILVDTKYDYGGHVMVVVQLDPLHDRVVISHPGFTFPEGMKLNKYSSFKNKAPKQGKAKYIIRWTGPTHAVHLNGENMSIREKLLDIIDKLHQLSRRGHNLDYSRFKGACMYMKKACFISNHKVGHQTLEKIQQSESFVCSSYGVFVWKYVLEQFLIPEELRNRAPAARTLDDIAFPINPYECLPHDLLQIAERFPDYWEIIPYYTKKIEFIEMNELTNKRLPLRSEPSNHPSSSSPSYSNISSMPYLLGGKRKSCRRRQNNYKKTRRTRRK